MVKMKYEILLAALTAMFFGHASFAEDIAALTEFGAWGVFKDDGACWITANADQAGDFIAEDQFAFVSFFYGDHIPEISFYTPDCCDGDVSAHSNDYKMPLFYFKDTLFPEEKDELDFLMSLLRSDSVEIVDDSLGARVMSFPLIGFRDAYNEVSQICEFRPMYLKEEGQNSSKG